MKPPTVTKGVASHYANPNENIYDVNDERSGGLISVSRIPDDKNFMAPGALVISAYRLDADVKVQAPAENLLITDAVILTAQRVMELTSTALSNVQLKELEKHLLGSEAFATLLQTLVDQTLETTP